MILKSHTPLPCGGRLVESPDLRLSLALLNSCEIESHLDEDHRGHLCEDQLKAVLDAWSGAPKDGWTRIAALHHNPRATVPADAEDLITKLAEKGEDGLDEQTIRRYVADLVGLEGREELRRVAIKGGVSILLHGHFHASTFETWKWATGGETLLLASGSFGLSPDAVPKDQRNVVRLVGVNRDGHRIRSQILTWDPRAASGGVDSGAFVKGQGEEDYIDSEKPSDATRADAPRIPHWPHPDPRFTWPLSPGRPPTSNLPRERAFFGRHEELERIAKALDHEIRTWGVLIDGEGGIGKTVLALRAAHAASDADYPLKLFLSAKAREMTSSGEKPLEDYELTSFQAVLKELGRLLGDDLGRDNPDARARIVLTLLSKYPSLLLIDNLETLAESDRIRLYQFLAQLPNGSKAIVTSRRRTDSYAQLIRLGRMSRTNALKLLDDLTKHNPKLASSTLDERERLYEISGGNPLVLSWIAGQVGRPGSGCRTMTHACDFLLKSPPGNDPLEYAFGDLLDTFTGSETAVLAGLTHFKSPAKVDWIAKVADLDVTSAGTALVDLADRSVITSDPAEEFFHLSSLTAAFIRRKHSGLVVDTRDRLVRQAMAIVFENGYQNYESFSNIEENWSLIDVALPRIVEGENTTIQEVRVALSTPLDFMGKWDDWLSLSKWAGESANINGDWDSAGWCAYQAGWVSFLRGNADDVLTWADRASEAWAKSPSSGGLETTHAEQLRAFGRELAGDLQAARQTYENVLRWHKEREPESRSMVLALLDHGQFLESQNELDEAEKVLREALALSSRKHTPFEVAICRISLATVALKREDWTEAEDHAQKVIGLTESYPSLEMLGCASWRLAKAYAGQGRAADGRPFAQQAIEIFSRLRKHDELREARAALEACDG